FESCKGITEMNNCFIDKKVMLCTSVLIGAICLTGCGKTSEEEKALAVFSSSVADFTDYIQEADEKINSLDINQKESVNELLEILDGLDAEFAEFAERSKNQTPDQYESVPGLAEQASEEMSHAVSYYHTAYESDEFDENYADAAYKYYTNSMEEVKCIVMLLLGEKIPEGDHITVYEITNDENILDKWLSGDKEDENAENETTSEGISEAVN
ncbi:MAG: hypothetical protein K2G55_08665, partial [Lachnospiraceae bacterium]|nr:hypothetical protein [Lachnospiraceae bacterium]